MKIEERPAKSILSPQTNGFLATPPYPFTHTLSAYTGCGFGNTYCGKYCYAQTLPSWEYGKGEDDTWGGAVFVKINAPALLRQTLSSMKPEKRKKLRIFMSSATDPYQPIEKKYEITRQLLEVFADFDDLDLLVIQTRSLLVQRDFQIIKRIPYTWLSMTIETDDEGQLEKIGKVAATPLSRMVIARTAAVLCDIPTQIVVSPCLPFTENFAPSLKSTAVRRIVVDDFVEGDGSRGQRTAKSEFAKVADYDWREPAHSRRLMSELSALGIAPEWSSKGFCGIPPRETQPSMF